MDPRLEAQSEQVDRPETWPPVVIDGAVYFDEPLEAGPDDDEEPQP